MFEKLKNFFKKASREGLHFPFVYNPKTKTPSVTLLFAYITFVLALVSSIALHFYLSLLTATIASITFWVLAVIFYRLNKLDSVKFNLKDQSFELDADDENEENEEKEEK